MQNIYNKYFSKDPTLRSLLCVNVIIIIFAVFSGWDARNVMTTYWVQSIIIGFFAVINLLTYPLEKYLYSFLGEPDISSVAGKLLAFIVKIFFAGFFLVHYGGFHFGYFMLIFGFFGASPINIFSIPIALFFINHLYSYWYFRNQAAPSAINFLTIFMAPYSRIFPMHISIFVGMFLMTIVQEDYNLYLLIFFMAIKTFFDLRSHYQKHNPRSFEYPTPENALRNNYK